MEFAGERGPSKVRLDGFDREPGATIYTEANVFICSQIPVYLTTI